MKQKKDIIKIFLYIVIIVSITLQIGITIGCYIITKIDYNKFEEKYNIEILK